MNQPLRLPAHGKTWIEARRTGLTPAAGIFGALVLLDHWRIAPDWPVLVIPADTAPANLDFGVLRGLGVTLVYHSRTTDYGRLLAAVDAILRGGAAMVATLDRDGLDRGLTRRGGAA